MAAKSARSRRTLRAVKPAARQRSARPKGASRPGEVIELVYQLMMERGGIPRRSGRGKDADDHELLMAEAP